MSKPVWDPYDRDCPTRQLLDRIGDRWTVLVIGTLADGPRRYTEIARKVDGVSQKMLTQTLRALEHDGIVSRTVFPEIPPRVEYRLTARGESLREPLHALEEWAKTNMADVLDSRSRAEIAAAHR
nr:helix-turn-helix domain-containing protein [Microbacterium bovistercoris]